MVKNWIKYDSFQFCKQILQRKAFFASGAVSLVLKRKFRIFYLEEGHFVLLIPEILRNVSQLIFRVFMFPIPIPSFLPEAS